MSYGAVIDWPTSNLTIAYPFIDKVLSPSGLHELFADAYVYYSANTDNVDRVKLTTFNPAGDCVLKFEDDTAFVTLTSADGFTSTTYGPWTVLQWVVQETDNPATIGREVAVRFLLYTDKLVDFTFPVSPVNALFVDGITERATGDVRRIFGLLNKSMSPTADRMIRDQITVEAGYNIRLDIKESGQEVAFAGTPKETPRPATTITVNVEPGAGWGKYPICAPVDEIKLINGVGPDENGNIQLSPKDCYWIEGPLQVGMGAPVYPGTDYSSSVTPNTLRLHNNCTPCCSCDDYVNVYSNLKRVWDRAVAASQRMETVRARYNEVRDLMLAAKEEHETGLTLSLRLLSRPDFTVSLLAVLSNNSKDDILTPIPLQFALVPDPNVIRDKYIPRSGVIDAEEMHGKQLDPVIMGDGGYVVNIPYLRSSQFAVYSFDVRYGKSTDPNVLRTGVNIKVVGVAVVGTQVTSVIRYVTLEKPIVKD